MIEFQSQFIKHLFPKTIREGDLARVFNELFPVYEINTVNRIAGFLTQTSHRSSNYINLVEKLNYNSHGLRSVFPKYFRDDVTVKQYENKPEKIANLLYADKFGNGNEASGDGWRYRNRGAIPIIGRDAYDHYANSVNLSIDEAIKELETLDGAIKIACYYWKEHDLNQLCDLDDIDSVTELVQPNNLTDCKSTYNRIKKILSETTNV